MASRQVDENLVLEIAELQRRIREKQLTLKRGSVEEDLRIEKQLKPLTDPLSKLLNEKNTEGGPSETATPKVLKREEVSNPENRRTRRSKTPDDDTVDEDERLDDTWKDLMTGPYRYANLKRGSDGPGPSYTKKKTPDESMDAGDPHRMEEMDTTVSLPVEFTEEDATAGTSVEMRDQNRPQATPTRRLPRDEEFSTPTTIEELLSTPLGKVRASIWVKNTFPGRLARRYMHEAITDSDNNTDSTYGVHFEGNELMMGDSTVQFGPDDSVIVGDESYPGTVGLYELIFKRKPDPFIYSEEDLEEYKNILDATNAHRRNNSALGQVKANTGKKYVSIISRLYPPKPDRPKRGKGMRIGPMMELNKNRKTEYVYFDDPNELCDRLRLLVASRDSGHTGHDSEINSIVEELKELGLIRGDPSL